MAFFDALSQLLTTVLRLFLWMAAAVLGLAFVSVALSLVLGWILVNRLLGRQPKVTLSGRFQDLRQFGAGFGQSGFGGVFRPRQEPAPTDSSTAPADSPLSRRIPSPGEVQDVQARDLPPDPPRS